MTLPIIMLVGNAGVGKDTVAAALNKTACFKRMAQADAIKRIGKLAFEFTDEQLWGPSENRNAVDKRFAPGSVPYKQLFVNGEDPFDDGLSTVCTAFHKVTGVGNVHGFVYAVLKKLKAFADENGGLSARIVLQLLGTEVGRAADQLLWTRATLNEANKALDAGAPGVVITDGRFLSEVLAAKRAGALVWKVAGSSTLTGATHASETELASIPEYLYDVVLHNNKEFGIGPLEDAVQRTFEALFRPHQSYTFSVSDD